MCTYLVEEKSHDPKKKMKSVNNNLCKGYWDYWLMNGAFPSISSFFQHCSLCIVEDHFQLASLVLKQIIMEKQNVDQENAR